MSKTVGSDLQMLKQLILFLLFSVWALGGDTVLIAQYADRNDAVQMMHIVRRLLTGRYHVHTVVTHSADTYNVIVRPVKNPDMRAKIIAKIRTYFGLPKHPRTPRTSTPSGLIAVDTGYAGNLYHHTRIDTTDYGPLVLDNNTSQVGDLFHREYAAWHWKPTLPDTHLIWNMQAAWYHKGFRAHSDMDTTRIMLQTGPAYRCDIGTIGLLGSREKVWYGGAPLLDRYRLDIPLVYQPTAQQQWRLNFSAAATRFAATAHQDMDSNRWELSGAYAWTVNPDVSERIEWYYAKERKLRGTRADIAHDTYGVVWRSSYHLTSENTLTLDIGMAHKSYIEKALTLAVRSDTRWTMDVALHHRLDAHTDLAVMYSGIENRSTLEAYTFRSHTLAVRLSKTF